MCLIHRREDGEEAVIQVSVLIVEVKVLKRGQNLLLSGSNLATCGGV